MPELSNTQDPMVVGNWTHATKIFVDGQYRLSPQNKWLFYIYFDINEPALQTVSSAWQKKIQGLEMGQLCKRANLPKFKFDTETKNQYNRKRIIHKTLQYQPCQLALHDDSTAVVSSLMSLYYAYYVKDRTNTAAGDWVLDEYAIEGALTTTTRYGLDSRVDHAPAQNRPFFKSIQIFTLSRQKFVGYTLINPRITSWQHGDVDYFASEHNEAIMDIEFEAVHYTAGSVTVDTPTGWATLNYDSTESPLPSNGSSKSGIANQSSLNSALNAVNPTSPDLSASRYLTNLDNFSLTNPQPDQFSNLSLLGGDEQLFDATGNIFPTDAPATNFSLLSGPESLTSTLSGTSRIARAATDSAVSTTTSTEQPSVLSNIATTVAESLASSRPSVPSTTELLSVSGLDITLPVAAGFPLGNIAQIGADILNSPTNQANAAIGGAINDLNNNINDALGDLL